MDAEEEDEKLCRYCFEGTEAGELISPCACKGGQKYVHLECLRRWQRMVLVSQPTHPAFYSKDPRHHECNVCKSKFTCAPPTRHELMASFTGPELGALVKAGCVIGAHATFTEELERQMESMSPFGQQASSYAHWCGGAYLITAVSTAESSVELTLDSQDALDNMRERLGSELRLRIHGETLRLAARGSFDGLEPMALRSALNAPYAEPLEIVLERDPPPGCGDDHVTAVNVTRPLHTGAASRGAHARLFAWLQAAEEGAYAAVCAKHAAASSVVVSHFIGGPCNPSSVACCVVPGGTGCGWTVLNGDKECAAATPISPPPPLPGCRDRWPPQRARPHTLSIRSAHALGCDDDSMRILQMDASN